MFKFLIGVATGAIGMYFGSDVVADNCARAAYYSEQTLKNTQMIDQKAMEKIAQWSYDGTLQQHLHELATNYGNQFQPIKQG